MPDLFSFDEERVGPFLSSARIREVDCRSALSVSRLPGLDHALNPYRGCEHNCVYCYAPSILRVDRWKWGRFVEARVNIPTVLARELRKKAAGTVGIGTVTDPYQPVEASYQLTRKCLKELLKAGTGVSVHTKSDLVTRDIDLLRRFEQAEVGVTITTLDDSYADQLEPLAPRPGRRLEALERLSSAGVDAYLLLGPLLPEVNEGKWEEFMARVAETGTRRVMLDAFRGRPGVREAMLRLPMMGDDRLRERFMAKLDSPSFYEGARNELAIICLHSGMELVDAF
jgi:DNA repair photolyase